MTAHEILKTAKVPMNYSEAVREETRIEAKRILSNAIRWIDCEFEKPRTNNCDAVAMVANALEVCGI